MKRRWDDIVRLLTIAALRRGRLGSAPPSPSTPLSFRMRARHVARVRATAFLLELIDVSGAKRKPRLNIAVDGYRPVTENASNRVFHHRSALQPSSRCTPGYVHTEGAR